MLVCDKCQVNKCACLCTPAKEFTKARKLGKKVSIALSTTPEHAAACNAEAIRRGVKPPYQANGDCVFTDPGHERDYHKNFGWYNKDGGYNCAEKGYAQRKFGIKPIENH